MKYKFFQVLLLVLVSNTLIGQIARTFDFKDIINIKNSKIYFVIPEGKESFEEFYKDEISKHWTFCDIEVIKFEELESIKKEKGIYMMSTSGVTITMGKSSPGDLVQTPGTSTRVFAFFISDSIKKSTFSVGKRWGSGFFTNNPIDLIQFFPFYLKTINSMFQKIEKNKVKKFNGPAASEFYSSDNLKINDKMVYILDEQIPNSKKGKKFKKLSEINKKYQGSIQIVSREELAEAITNEEDVIFLHFYKELKTNVYSAISCKTGETVALGFKKMPLYWKFFEWTLEDLNKN